MLCALEGNECGQFSNAGCLPHSIPGLNQLPSLALPPGMELLPATAKAALPDKCLALVLQMPLGEGASPQLRMVANGEPA